MNQPKWSQKGNSQITDEQVAGRNVASNISSISMKAFCTVFDNSILFGNFFFKFYFCCVILYFQNRIKIWNLYISKEGNYENYYKPLLFIKTHNLPKCINIMEREKNKKQDIFTRSYKINLNIILELNIVIYETVQMYFFLTMKESHFVPQKIIRSVYLTTRTNWIIIFIITIYIMYINKWITVSFWMT